MMIEKINSGGEERIWNRLILKRQNITKTES